MCYPLHYPTCKPAVKWSLFYEVNIDQINVVEMPLFRVFVTVPERFIYHNNVVSKALLYCLCCLFRLLPLCRNIKQWLCRGLNVIVSCLNTVEKPRFKRHCFFIIRSKWIGTGFEPTTSGFKQLLAPSPTVPPWLVIK